MALSSNKARFIEILTAAFADNLSVNYIVQQDHKKQVRITRLMEYAYATCERYGKVISTEDGHGCALVLFPDQKKFSLRSLLLDLKLILGVTGLGRLFKILKREQLVNAQHPHKRIYYLWFVAIDPAHQGKGLGTELLRKLIADANSMQRPFYLETSTLKNIPWYEKNGFRIFHELDIGYRLYFLRHSP
jgi:Acetyltransferases